MYKKTYWLLLIAFNLVHATVAGQSETDALYLKFQHGKTEEVIALLQKEREQRVLSQEKVILLSTAYAEKGNLTEAINCLKPYTGKADASVALIENYGHLLKKTGNYREAHEMYLKLVRFDETVSKMYADGCNEALKLYAEKASDNAKAVPFIVSEDQEIAPGMWGQIHYHGTSGTDSDTKNGADLAVASSVRLSAVLQASFVFDNTASKTTLPGALLTDKSGRRFVWISHVARSDYSYTCMQHWGALMTGEFNQKGEIAWIRVFPWNEVDSEIHSACLSPDGNTLYFSSNRDGGLGGFDLYESTFTGESWTKPENLGAPINSRWDEITPFAAYKSLFYSTDNPMGLGGFDIFSAKHEIGKWSEPVNQGTTVNSTEDDCYPYFSNDGSMYFSSNRIGSLGGKDLYVSYKNQPASDDKSLADLPKAVRIDEISVAGVNRAKEPDGIHTVAYKTPLTDEKLPATLKSNTHASTDAYLSSADLSLARRIAIDALVPDNEVFFIQLASVAAGKPDFQKYTPLLKYGNIYKMYINRAIKVRLGYFTDRTEAEAILAKVKSNGYRDAFLAHEWLNKAQMELVLSGSDEKDFTDKTNFGAAQTDNTKIANKSSRYKVRLAAYEDPIWFDVNKVRDLGRIEQWTKANWTIFILAGYQNLDEAKEARIKALNRGFNTAEIVIDNDGILERLKQQ